LGNGDILGASGIVSSFLKHPIKAALDPQLQWRVYFLSSFLVTSIVYVKLADPNIIHDLTPTKDAPIVSSIGFAIAGALVGLGTKLANGCTSGHGICGLARFSRRSLIAVGTFLPVGILTGSLIPSQAPIIRTLTSSPVTRLSSYMGLSLTLAVSALAIPSLFKPIQRMFQSVKGPSMKQEELNSERKRPVALISGSIFALGLSISGMVKNSKVFAFLNVTTIPRGSWDGTLVTVLASGLLVSILGYQFVPNHCVCAHKWMLKRPLRLHESASFSVPTNQVIDVPLVLGSALFGIGWGIGGVCPGPALFLAATGVPQILAYWWPSYFIGATVGDYVKKYFV
jgi:uncharacterized membrane protein YedE/YeeE